MGKQKETRSRIAVHERAAETGAASKQTTNSDSQFTTSTPPRQRISRFLGHGAENGVTLRELVSLTGWNERDIRLAIRAERLQGVPILSNNQSGYYLPGDDREKIQFARSMRRRAAEIVKVAEVLERGN